jgi:hypothetical protein
MKISDLLGAVVQSGMTRSSNDRMKNSMGGGGGVGGGVLMTIVGAIKKALSK